MNYVLGSQAAIQFITMPPLGACGKPLVLITDPALDFINVQGDQIEIYSTSAPFATYSAQLQLCREEDLTICALLPVFTVMIEDNSCNTIPAVQLAVSPMHYTVGSPSVYQPVMIPPPDACGSFEVFFDGIYHSFMFLTPDQTNPN